MNKSTILTIDAQATLSFALKLFMLFPSETRAGTAELMRDGKFRIRFSVSGNSAERARQLARNLMASPTREVQVKYFGQDINPN